MATTVSSLTEQKASLKSQFDALVKQRIAATKTVKKFEDNGELQRLQNEIAVIDEALPVVEAEEAAEEERLAHEFRAKHVQGLHKDATNLESKRLACIGAAEKAAIQLADALTGAFSFTDDLATKLRALGYPDNVENLAYNMEHRLADRIMRAFSKIPTRYGVMRTSLGRLMWAGEQPRTEDWTAEEKQELAGMFALLARMLKDKA